MNPTILLIRNFLESIIGFCLIVTLVILIVIFNWNSPYILSHNILWPVGLVAMFLGMIIGASRYSLIKNDTPRFISGILAVIFGLFIHAITINSVMSWGHV